jgi:hypothetical protein
MIPIFPSGPIVLHLELELKASFQSVKRSLLAQLLSLCQRVL